MREHAIEPPPGAGAGKMAAPRRVAGGFLPLQGIIAVTNDVSRWLSLMPDRIHNFNSLALQTAFATSIPGRYHLPTVCANRPMRWSGAPSQRPVVHFFNR
jgi:hypothetical protein